MHTNPLPTLAPKEVISNVMAALHRSNWDSPKPLYGFEVALRFLAPTHAAKLRGAKAGGFARYLQQPHKISQISWNEYRYEGDIIYAKSDEGVEEAYQMYAPSRSLCYTSLAAALRGHAPMLAARSRRCSSICRASW